MSQKGVSIRPDTFIEGTGLIDDVDVIVKSARFTMFDYNGTRPECPAAKITLDCGEDEIDQYYTVGKASDWMPSDDGKKLVPVGRAEYLNKSSNYGIFMDELIKAGFPMNKIEDDISIFDSLEGHVIRIPAPERKGLKKKESDFQATVLVFNKIYQLPWEKKKKPPSGSNSSKKTPKQSKTNNDSQSDSSIQDKATEFIMEVLAQNPDGIEKSKLATLAFQMRKDDPDRNRIVKEVFKDEFLSSVPLWSYEGGKLKPAK